MYVTKHSKLRCWTYYFTDLLTYLLNGIEHVSPLNQRTTPSLHLFLFLAILSAVARGNAAEIPDAVLPSFTLSSSSSSVLKILLEAFFLVGYVEERLWWPTQSPNTEGKKKASS